MKILLGLSGGVDSTYAALKLKNEGHEVEGAVVLMHPYTDISGAERSASELGIRLHVIDAASAFENTVCRNFVSEYINGRTPNPCIICNREVKFRYLCDYAREHGFDAVATGHYAEVCSVTDGLATRYYVAPAKDSAKDQSYMLSRLSQDVLSMLILPMSGEIKSDIYEAARKVGLSSADKPESQEICFIPDGKYTDYIEKRAGACARGNFVDREGRVLGEHKGIIHYTVGQRKGLEIALGKRVFVTDIDSEKNTVTLEDAPALSDTVYVEDIVFSKIAPPKEPAEFKLAVKLRYLAKLKEAAVTVYPDGRAIVRLCEPQPSVTPGQSAVFYDADGCVFSGIIVKKHS